jgi:hypothetical protein
MKARSPRLSRRNFLRASAGALVALPLLDSLRAGAAEPVYPKRLVLIYNPNGTIQDAFWPTDVRDETHFELGEILAPLAAHRDKLLILKGLTNTIAASDVGPGGPHQKGIGALFTGRELLEGQFRDGCGSLAGWANGISIDQEIAKVLGADSALPSLELGVRAAKNDVQARISYAGPNQPLPPMNSPREVYFRLLSGLDTGSPELTALRDSRRSVLDTVQEQFQALESRVSSDDRQKLAQHQVLVRDLERRLDLVTGNAACVVVPEPPELAFDSETTMEQIAGLQVDLLAMAFRCDLVRVASLQFSDGLNTIRFPWMNSMLEGHSLSHSGDSDMDARTQLIGRHRWYVQQIGRLLDALAAIPEGSGTALDNTLIVWGNEVGAGNTHSHDNIPFLLAGSAGRAFRTGRFIDFGGRSHIDLLVSVLNAFGVNVNTFGHAEFVSGPLPGLT